MNLSLDRLPWYGQVGVFVVLALAGVGVFWNFYAVPAQESLDQRAAQLATLRAEIDRALETARRVPEMRREAVTLEAELERLRAVLPEERDVADLLRRVQATATQANLVIRGFTPAAVARRELHMEWPIGLQLEGTYHDLGDFLARLSRFPRIINVSGFRIRANEDGGDGNTILAECTATTFVLLENPQATAPAAGAAVSSTE